MKEFPFYTAYTQAETFYGVTPSSDDFETIGINAWDKIGNKRVRWYKYVVQPQKDSLGNWYVDLPCNCDIIEAVTAGYEDSQRTSATHLPGELQNGWVEDYVEDRKFNTGMGYIPGKFIKYNREGDRLYLSDKFDKVIITYKGVLLDEEGLPSLNEKELDAIAAFVAYVISNKKALVTKDQLLFQFAQSLKLEWEKKCTQARVPDYLNLNEMDEILNASVSWDRKMYGKSYKPLK